MRTRELMRTPAVTVPPSATLVETAQQMRERTVGCVVVWSDGTVQGIVTDRDLAVRGLAAEVSADAPVSDVMTAPVLTVRAEDDVDVAYQAMHRAGVRRLPVVDGSRLIGLVALDDLLMDVSRRLGEVLEPLAWCALGELPGPPHSAEVAHKPRRAPGL
ncbi:CBS domain-containing protein [Streptomyces lydicus]|uniref:CBS domain-containing protein n=1 Tax=Streptomyces lydicus TaxID=47763 RepID=UPI002870786A|nr:CBS domain-containing protein [Streptomyces lydicus]